MLDTIYDVMLGDTAAKIYGIAMVSLMGLTAVGGLVVGAFWLVSQLIEYFTFDAQLPHPPATTRRRSAVRGSSIRKRLVA